MKVNHKVKAGLMAFAVLGLAACGARTAAPAAAPVAPTAAPAATAVPPTAAPAAPTPTTAAAAPAATVAAPTVAAAAPAAAAVFQIDAAKSSATFTLDEKLMGNPKTVVGKTTLVSGEIMLTPDNLANTKIGIIQISARDLKTDSDKRDGAIARFILESSKDENQYITFEPTAIEGLPATMKTGEAATFKITGNLKIRSVVKPVTFETTVTAKSDTELVGSAKTVVKRTVFELNIPSVPMVADVTDDVALELTFVATKK